MLAKISSVSKEGVDLKELAEIFGCKVVDVKDKIYTIEVSGKTKKTKKKKTEKDMKA